MFETGTYPASECGLLHNPGGFIFIDHGKALILTRKGNTALVDEDISRELQKGENPIANREYLVQRGILQPANNEKAKINPVTYFIIDIVKNCNFNCIYCFRCLQDKRIISFEQLDAILRFIESYCKEKNLYRIRLQMWGGEPLLALDRIEYTVKFFNKTSISAIIDVETNGSFVTDKIAKKLYDLGVQVGVSIDGTPDIQNLQRPFVNGQETSDIVEKGIRNLQKYSRDSIGGITVVTKYNYKKIKEMLDYYIYHLGLRALKFNIVRDNPHATHDNLSLTSSAVSIFANELFDYLYAFNSIGNHFSEGNMDVRIRNILYQCTDNLCISHGCQGGRGIISFSQTGGIYPCEMTDFEEERIGSIDSGRSLDEMIESAIHRNSFFKKKESTKCSNCPWWCYCKGGCTSRNRFNGIAGEPDECECALNRAIYPRIVEGILDGIIGG